MGCIGDQFGNDTPYLREFFHEVGLCLKSSGRVDDANIARFFDRARHRAVRDTGWITPRRCRHNLRSYTFGPDGELLNRCGAKGIAGAEHYGMSFVPHQLC